MAKNLLVLNIDLRETRVALIEDGIIAELHIERASTTGTLGNIYLGKVTRVLPGMQAAFIDVGQERAAFLHVEDLIRPDDFEAYLAGAKRPDHEEASAPDASDADGEAEPERVPVVPSLSASEVGAPEVPASGEWGPDAAAAPEGAVQGEPAAAEAAASDDTAGDDEPLLVAGDVVSEDDLTEVLEAEAEELDAEDLEVDADETDGAAAAEDDVEGEGEAAEDEDDVEGDDEPGDVAAAEAGAEPSSEPGAPAPEAAEGTAPAAATEGADPRGQRSRRRRDRGRRGGKGGGREGQQGQAQPAPQGQQAQQGQRGRDGQRGGRPSGDGRAPAARGRGEPPRVSRSTPIRDVVREGQQVVVQISKEPIGTKGARVTSHVSLPGRYVVYMPTVDHIGISKRIGSDKERSRLREAIDSVKPPTGGLIVRTVAEGLTKKQLKADVGYLVRLWEEVAKKKEAGARAPALLYQEMDLVLKTARDLFTDEIEQIVVDDKEQYQRLVRFVESFLPERVKDIHLYSGEEPIFDAYGIEDEIARALSRKVPLPSGGHLIIDQAEALTAIDVNTGRFVGKGSKDLEDTLLKTNLEAVEEIAYQLRFRNLGGLIVLDLIDMDRASSREKVRRRLEDLLQKDKAKTTLNRISDLGLIEMTRKRTRESLGRLMHEPCFYCDGTGQLQSKQTVAYEIMRQIRRDLATLPGYIIVVNAHPAVIDLMKSEEREAVQEAERRFMRRIELVPRKEYHLEQFDLAGR